MAKVTIVIEDGPDDKVGVKVSFAPGVGTEETAKTPAQELATRVMKRLKEEREQGQETAVTGG